ncbi:hypothetical protein JQX13_12895 [Archangium violaceum]|uniref:hypothetical protein n=1 Tax=Archangium violaceum TaxID=83451 RepID=UPI00193B528B|nr:hypothetical protein [Archangium violaceum]QRK10882.1 hypothetical protein JQX13_12895 [Archangium violaceum]
MPEVGESVSVASGDQSQDPDEQETPRECPVCGAVWKKKEPTLGQVRRAIQEVFSGFKVEVKALDAAALLGYRGSVAAGVVGNRNKPHYGYEPDIRGECGTKYDIDGFLISKKLFDTLPKDDKGRCWGSRDRNLRALQSSLRRALTGRAELTHMKNEFGFRVWHPRDQNYVTQHGAIIVIW